MEDLNQRVLTSPELYLPQTRFTAFPFQPLYFYHPGLKRRLLFVSPTLHSAPPLSLHSPSSDSRHFLPGPLGGFPRWLLSFLWAVLSPPFPGIPDLLFPPPLSVDRLIISELLSRLFYLHT